MHNFISLMIEDIQPITSNKQSWNPDFENLLSDGRIVSEKKVENNVLRVIYTRDRNKYVILSFYYLNK